MKPTDLIDNNTVEWFMSKTTEGRFKEATAARAQRAANHMSVKQKTRLHLLSLTTKLKR